MKKLKCKVFFDGLCALFIQVRDTAIRTLVEIYRHVGEKVRIDLGKRGIPPTR